MTAINIKTMKYLTIAAWVIHDNAQVPAGVNS